MSGKQLIDDISAKLDGLKTLEINTVVGDLGPNNKPKPGAKVIVSKIDLLEGDITTAFSEDFLEPPLDAIRIYHSEREKQGLEIIDGNIKALKELVDLAIKVIRAKKTADAEPSDSGSSDGA